jgi:hypothetical protein
MDGVICAQRRSRPVLVVERVDVQLDSSAAIALLSMRPKLCDNDNDWHTGVFPTVGVLMPNTSRVYCVGDIMAMSIPKLCDKDND